MSSSAAPSKTPTPMPTTPSPPPQQQQENQTPPQPRVLGVIGGSSLFHATSFSSGLVKRTVETTYGGVVCHVGSWTPEKAGGEAEKTELQLVFVQRHHADPDNQYKQPRLINYRAIAAALQQLQCEAVVGVYSVGSMAPQIEVGRLVVLEDYFNPFDVLHLSHDHTAHVVPELNPTLRTGIYTALESGGFSPYDGGVYVQTSGPRFETKAEVRFFAQFGQLIGMTGSNEAELMNELRVPFAMFGIVDNMANGMGEPLTLEAFRITQKQNADRMERAVCRVLDELTRSKALDALSA